MSDADSLIAALGLAPHPEGGHFRETFRDTAGPNGRSLSTAIYFLLRKGEFSKWHRIDAVEVWHWYKGAPLELLVKSTPHDPSQRRILGPRLENGERPQQVVPAGTWQSARSLGDYSLVGCTVAPGFEFAKLEIA
jgi:predicted cupin superfamily sugar epimerase